jgi:hypothetical protein
LSPRIATPGFADGMMRIGIIGLDTSHAPELARYFNSGDGSGVGRIVAAWPGGSPDAPLSINRVAGFTTDVRDKYGVEIFETPEAAAERCDALLLLAMDGRAHLELFRRIAGTAKSIFVNKPLATSRRDAEQIAAIARDRKVPWFSASALRCAGKGLHVERSIEVSCPLWFEPANAGWFWYGVHGVELLSAALGGGIGSVRVEVHSDHELLTARWRDGREGRVRGVLSRDAGFAVICDGGRQIALPVEMAPLSAAIGDFFRTGTVPVAIPEMLEVVACLEAANLSRARGGVEIALNP